MLGRYENFPEAIHGVARFTHRLSVRKLQQAVLHALHRLNQETCNLDAVAPFSLLKCEVSFEFGVAEGNAFNYLDKEELDRLERYIVKRALPILDFLCVVRYHVTREGKRIPLRFDYHLLRLTFQRRNVQLQIFHERGTQRVSLEDLITFITKCIKNELSQRQLKPLSLKYSRTL
ncbi:MAG: hypothetical protein ACE5OW_00235 [Candidatus Bathyarchaeia archaeon]